MGEETKLQVKRPKAKADRAATDRLRLFDEATQRAGVRAEAVGLTTDERGWSREDLYDRGRPP